MTTEQKPEEKKPEVPVLITAGLVQLKINTDLTKNKVTIAELEKRALDLVINEEPENLKKMADLLKDCQKVVSLAEEVHQKTKKPYLDGGRECDAGKKLVLQEEARIRGMFEPKYNKLLDDIATKKRAADLKIATDKAIKTGIENNLITFSNMVVQAITKKALTTVESRINLEKSPSMAKKYGEFHQFAIERYDTVLLPIIKDQKLKIDELDGLNKQLVEAEANNDPDTMDAVMEKIAIVSNQILQNHSIVEEAALHQEDFPIEAVEVLPEVKTKRTNFSYEIADVEVAWKKCRELLEITIDNQKAKLIKDQLVKNGEFDDKDEVIKDGIKYIATRVREAI